MKKLLIAMAMMSAMAFAQTSSSTGTDQSSSSAGNPSATQSGSTSTSGDAQSQAPAKPESDKASAKGGKEKTLTGCLHKDGDNYWLKTHSTKYHVMASEDLSAHDGHEVKVTGTTSKAPLPGSTDKKAVNHVEATKVDMVADKCSMGESSVKMKGSEMEKKDTTKK
jgi:uncharacterized protein YdeI (BOF family)